MFINDMGMVYDGQKRVGDREATAEEIANYQKNKTIAVDNINIQAQIAELESLQNRPLRELYIDPANQYAKDKIITINAQIAELRKGLK